MKVTTPPDDKPNAVVKNACEGKIMQFRLNGLGHAILGNFSTDQIVIELT